MDDYDLTNDPYCYSGTTVLKNLANLRRQPALTRFEGALTAQRADEPLPGGRLSVRHYQAIHHHLFQDVYDWAGKFRTVRISKGGNMFCYPEYISAQMRDLFHSLPAEGYLRSRSATEFAQDAGAFLNKLNAIHPFRDGNGRTQLSFMALVATRAGHPFHFERLDPRAFLAAMIRGFYGDDAPLAAQLTTLI
jgi:cell filamentation protein